MSPGNKCEPCKGVTAPLGSTAVRKLMSGMKGWKTDGRKITKEYAFRDDKAALKFLASAGKASVSAGHHPAAAWNYDKVRIELWTHSVNGLSMNDFALAKKFDELYGRIK